MKRFERLILPICFFAILLAGCQTKKITAPPMLSISGQVEWTQNYCGGASPTQEMIDALRTPKPLKGHRFYIKKGATNKLEAPVVAEVVTDSLGKFYIDLQPGEYILLMEQQLNKQIMNDPGKDIEVSNPQRMSIWWNKGLARINSSNLSISLKLLERCNVPMGVPFLRYTGPAVP